MSADWLGFVVCWGKCVAAPNAAWVARLAAPEVVCNKPDAFIIVCWGKYFPVV